LVRLRFIKQAGREKNGDCAIAFWSGPNTAEAVLHAVKMGSFARF
jgi:hypothetical protein